MITGAIILLAGIVIGYNLPNRKKSFEKLKRMSLKNDISDIFAMKAKIVDMSPEIDLSYEETKK